ncbi:hypothetical protein EC973_007492 [Apophysomyces ossiformis]|uniref:Uncharacterized protein n=1 Tax=Apophysomyces ossiformis TaxID=679940 RepID=A0A8H7EKL8_9FUNG|nr:hypothetical protein EC973_007492 [Apophysomyces ossiformis]
MPCFKCASCRKHLNHIEVLDGLAAFIPPPPAPAPLPNTNSQPLVFEHHEALPDFLKQITEKINSQQQHLDEHDHLITENARLLQELNQAKSCIAELETIIEHQRNQLDLLPVPENPVHSPEDFPSLPDAVRAVPRVSDPARLQCRQESTARAFVLPSATQGFQYLYFPARAQIPTGQMRRRFRQLGIENSRILDIHYLDQQVIAILVHNDFAPELKTVLSKFGVNLYTDYDPLDPKHLKDPKYTNLTNTEREQRAYEHHHERMLVALNFLHHPVRSAVARDFHSKGWIDPDTLQRILAARADPITDILGMV